MTRVLGIDPGSRITGYGVVDMTPQGLRLVECGCLKLSVAEFPIRLREIYQGIQQIVQRLQPSEMAIEQVFMHKNADSALKLGQARGAAMCGGFAQGLEVQEYAARQVKLAVVGKGNADKFQVQHMVKVLLGLQGFFELDASDALGVAICHIHHKQALVKMASAIAGSVR